MDEKQNTEEAQESTDEGIEDVELEEVDAESVKGGATRPFTG